MSYCTTARLIVVLNDPNNLSASKEMLPSTLNINLDDISPNDPKIIIARKVARAADAIKKMNKKSPNELKVLMERISDGIITAADLPPELAQEAKRITSSLKNCSHRVDEVRALYDAGQKARRVFQDVLNQIGSGKTPITQANAETVNREMRNITAHQKTYSEKFNAAKASLDEVATELKLKTGVDARQPKESLTPQNR